MVVNSCRPFDCCCPYVVEAAFEGTGYGLCRGNVPRSSSQSQNTAAHRSGNLLTYSHRRVDGMRFEQSQHHHSSAPAELAVRARGSDHLDTVHQFLARTAGAGAPADAIQ